MNLEKVQLIKQDKTLTDSLELLGLLDNSEDEYVSTQFECKHDTGAFHCHSLKEKQQGKTPARRKLLITCAVCLIFMIGEVIGENKRTCSTDAAHLLTDFGSISISLFALWISSRPPSKHRTFGWHRSEVLGSLLSVLSIWTMTVVLVLFAVQRLISDDYEIHSDACAVTLNIFLAFILHQSPVRHSHSHGLTEEHRSTSVKAAFIHMLGDLLQSLGVLLAASIIYFRVCTLLLLAYTKVCRISLVWALSHTYRSIVSNAAGSFHLNVTFLHLLCLMCVNQFVLVIFSGCMKSVLLKFTQIITLQH
uniref:Solute carrier family 30 member 2 n=1 Tax=Sinocyclocheilus rhinocerous TaxID=307959 RepID=A0A673L8B3_9TELE